MSHFWSRSSASSDPGVEALQRVAEYHALARDCVDRAQRLERSGNWRGAQEVWRTAAETIREGLTKVASAPNSGMRTSNIGKQRDDFEAWEELARQKIEGTAPGAGGSSGRGGGSNSSSSSQSGAGLSSSSRSRISSSSTARPLPKKQPETKRKTQQKSVVPNALKEMILSEIVQRSPGVAWDSISGLPRAKQSLQEAVILPTVRADLFTGLRSPSRGILLYGPPGNGKTLLAKAVASEARSIFFSISASSLTSKYVGEGEKLVRALFEMARELQPSIIFIDEVDSILGARKAEEQDASRRLKTEFLIQFDGLNATSSSSEEATRIMVLAATNRPWDLDEAVLRRLSKRIYIPLPNPQAREAIIVNLLKDTKHSLSSKEIQWLAGTTTNRFSGSDLDALCREAALGPIRDLGDKIASADETRIKPVMLKDFKKALQVIKPSANVASLSQFESFSSDFGSVG